MSNSNSEHLIVQSARQALEYFRSPEGRAAIQEAKRTGQRVLVTPAFLESAEKLGITPDDVEVIGASIEKDAFGESEH